MNEIKLSIVIPIYNSQKFLSRCLDSVLDFPLRSMECILINDGSTDSSVDICEQYLQKDSRFKLITIDNGGVSTARNMGISKANGKYLFFLDADDYLNSEGYNQLINAVESGYDFYAFSYYTLYDDQSTAEELFDFHGGLKTDLNTVYYLLFASSKLNTCWGKLMKTDIILENNIAFPAGMKTGEDAVFIINYIRYIKTCCIENFSILYYRQHFGSAMRKVNLERKLNDLKILYDTRIKFLKDLNLWKFEADVYKLMFSVVTNLLLEITMTYSYEDVIEKYKLIIENDMTKEIVGKVANKKLTPVFKKIEYFIIYYKAYNLLVLYFKLKQRFK